MLRIKVIITISHNLMQNILTSSCTLKRKKLSSFITFFENVFAFAVNEYPGNDNANCFQIFDH